MCAKTFRALQCSKLEINAVECTMCSTPLQSGAARSAAMSFAQQCAIYVQRFASLYLQRCATAPVFRARKQPQVPFVAHCSFSLPLSAMLSNRCLCWCWFYWLLPLSVMLSNHCLCWCWLLVIASVGNAV